MGLGGGGEPVTTTATTDMRPLDHRCRTLPTAAPAASPTSTAPAGTPGAEGHLAAQGAARSARRRLRRPARRLQAADAASTTRADWIDGAPTTLLLRVRRRHRRSPASGCRTPGASRRRGRLTLGAAPRALARATTARFANATGSATFAPRSENDLSPKAAIAWQASDAWLLQGLARPGGAHADRERAVPGVDPRRRPIVNNDPNLKPEKSWTAEFSATANSRRARRCARTLLPRAHARTRSIRRPTSPPARHRRDDPERRR